MGLYQTLRGLMNDLFQLGGPTGVQLKNGSGFLLVRNNTDSGYTQLYASAARFTGNTPAAGKVWTATNANGDGAWADPGASGGAAQWYAGDYKLSSRVDDHGKWLFCNGRDVSRATYATLFAQIGTTYGAGDGSTTFTIPDWRGYSLRGAGVAGDLTGVVGADSVTLVQGNLPQNTVINGGATALVSSGGSTAARLKGSAASSFNIIPATKRAGMFIYTG